VGYLSEQTLPYMDVNTSTRVFRHAVALDEVCYTIYTSYMLD